MIKKIFLIGMMLVESCMLSGCKESEGVLIYSRDESYEKERKFLSIVLSVPMDQVVYDQKNKQFVIYGLYQIDLDEVLHTYSRANEYKLKYEN